jgi:hypothetical protein
MTRAERLARMVSQVGGAPPAAFFQAERPAKPPFRRKWYPNFVAWLLSRRNSGSFQPKFGFRGAFPTHLKWLSDGLDSGGFFCKRCVWCNRGLNSALRCVGRHEWTGEEWTVEFGEGNEYYRTQAPPGGWVSVPDPVPPHGSQCRTASPYAADPAGSPEQSEFDQALKKLRAKRRKNPGLEIWDYSRLEFCEVRLRTELLDEHNFTLTN